MGKISPFVGKDETISPVVRIGPFVGIGLFGGTGPVVSLTYMPLQIADPLFITLSAQNEGNVPNLTSLIFLHKYLNSLKALLVSNCKFC